MSERGGAVHVVTTRRTYKGRVYETHLLRRSYRDGDRVKNETLGNLSHLPAPVIDLVRRALRGETFVPVAERLEVLGSRPHGHVQAVHLAMQRLGIESLIGSRPSPERDRILALIAARVLAPHTKLATTRWWHTSTLAEEFGVSAADEDDLYAAMDWLLERQPVIERKLAARHLGEGSLALYDLSSSYFEGTHCPLGKIGYSRDGKKNKLQVNYGLMTTRQGCPISVSVYEGNTSDTKTLMPQVMKLKESFGLERVVLVGDRGMISHKAIGELKDIDAGFPRNGTTRFPGNGPTRFPRNGTTGRSRFSSPTAHVVAHRRGFRSGTAMSRGDTFSGVAPTSPGARSWRQRPLRRSIVPQSNSTAGLRSCSHINPLSSCIFSHGRAGWRGGN
jgi:hypothetical protein